MHGNVACCGMASHVFRSHGSIFHVEFACFMLFHVELCERLDFRKYKTLWNILSFCMIQKYVVNTCQEDEPTI